MKMVKSKASKAFKTQYKLCFLAKHMPAVLIERAAAIIPGSTIPDPMKRFLESDEYVAMQRTYALMAITESCMRPLKDHELRAVVVSQARDCEAVVSSLSLGLIPPKFKSILDSV